MPQMAPISWLILFLLFSSIFFMFNIINFYCLNNKLYKNFKYNNIYNKKKINSKFNLNWKW